LNGFHLRVLRKRKERSPTKLYSRFVGLRGKVGNHFFAEFLLWWPNLL